MYRQKLLSVAKLDFIDISTIPQLRNFTWFCWGFEVKIIYFRKLNELCQPPSILEAVLEPIDALR
jgi:hypothetical protein